MKKTHKIAFALLLAAAGAQLQAQSNTFPASGKVGIGTTSPAQQLSISSGASTRTQLLMSDGNTASLMLAAGNSLPGVLASDANLQLRTGVNYPNADDTNRGITAMTILAGSGKVGIGTTNPAQQLSISSGASTRTQLLMSDGNTASLMLAAGNSLPGVLASDANLQLRTGVNYPNADDTNRGITAMTILAGSGYVGIGTASPGYLLDVNGTIHAQGVVVDMTGADYVFAPNYKLMPLAQVEQAIKRDQHLPGIPSAKDMSSGGVSVGDLQAKLLAKVEELTLHVIAQQKELDALKSENAAMQARLDTITK